MTKKQRKQIWIMIFIAIILLLSDIGFINVSSLTFIQSLENDEAMLVDDKLKIEVTSNSETDKANEKRLNHELERPKPTNLLIKVDKPKERITEEDEREELKRQPVNHKDSKEPTIVSNPDAIDVLVNKLYILPSSYAPSDLIIPNVSFASNGNYRLLRKEASTALEALFQGASDDGHKLHARSGYRSFEAQKAIFESSVRRHGSAEMANRISAKAGQSEHQTGLAMDITANSVKNQLANSFAKTAEGNWVAENAHKYGFIIRFPEGKESITGYTYEPWHIRYIGVELATDVYNSGLTYEEYLGL